MIRIVRHILIDNGSRVDRYERPCFILEESSGNHRRSLFLRLLLLRGSGVIARVRNVLRKNQISGHQKNHKCVNITP